MGMRILPLVLSILLGGCTWLQPKSPEERVLERAEAHLAALRAGDFAEALTYTTPSFQASAKARRYGALYSAAPAWRQAEVYRVDCPAGDAELKCEAHTRIHPFVPPHIQANITDLPVSVKADWLFLDGNWYRYED